MLKTKYHQRQCRQRENVEKYASFKVSCQKTINKRRRKKKSEKKPNHPTPFHLPTSQNPHCNHRNTTHDFPVKGNFHWLVFIEF